MDLSDFIERYMRLNNRLVAGRIQAALVLVERLREHPSLDVNTHFTSCGSHSFTRHEQYGSTVLARFDLPRLNVNHGRRSANVREWAQPLLDLFRTEALGRAFTFFDIEDAQRQLGQALRECQRERRLNGG